MLHKLLHQRNQIYYFRWRIPSELKPILKRTEIIQSLQTKDKYIALNRASANFELVTELKALRSSLLLGALDLDRFSTLAHKACEGRLKASDKPKLSQVLEEFIVHKLNSTGLSKKHHEQYIRDVTTVIELMGDKPINEISQKDCRNCFVAYSELPLRNKSPYKGLSISKLIEFDVPSEDLIAPKTVKAAYSSLRALFNFAVNEQEYISSSPLNNYGLNLSSTRTFGAYNFEEIRKLENAALDYKDWHKWMLLLGIYTGARLGELAQLRKQDVMHDMDSGRHYILITPDAGSVKSNSSIRKVPLHLSLINYGFLDFVSSMDVQLFPNLRTKQVTQWFTDLRERLEIPYLDELGNRKVFHSLRHTFITAASIHVDIVKIQRVVGHTITSNQKLGVTQRYLHQIPIKDLLCVVDEIDYSDHLVT